jgi:hypothetical protein
MASNLRWFGQDVSFPPTTDPMRVYLLWLTGGLFLPLLFFWLIGLVWKKRLSSICLIPATALGCFFTMAGLGD